MIVEKPKQKQSNYSDFCFLLAARTCRFSLSLPGFGVRFVFYRFVLQSQTVWKGTGSLGLYDFGRNEISLRKFQLLFMLQDIQLERNI